MKCIKFGLVMGICFSSTVIASEVEEVDVKPLSGEVVSTQYLVIENDLDENLEQDISNALQAIKQKKSETLENLKQ